MRRTMALLVIAAIICAVLVGDRFWLPHQFSFRAGSSEIVKLSPVARVQLQRLRAEPKFRPHAFPPLGYTGAANSHDQTLASDAVDRVITSILEQPGGVIEARMVAQMFRVAMHKVWLLDTEDSGSLAKISVGNLVHRGI